MKYLCARIVSTHFVHGLTGICSRLPSRTGTRWPCQEVNGLDCFLYDSQVPGAAMEKAPDAIPELCPLGQQGQDGAWKLLTSQPCPTPILITHVVQRLGCPTALTSASTEPWSF